MNPASGPGGAADPHYGNQVAATRSAGVQVIGYMYSSFAARDISLVKADIDARYAWYEVDGIFIDEASNDCADASCYAELDSYMKARGDAGTTVINPGTNTPECYAATADILLNFEGSYASYQGWSPSGWEAGYDPGRFWHLVYAAAKGSVPAADASTTVADLVFPAGAYDDVVERGWRTNASGTKWQWVDRSVATFDGGGTACELGSDATRVQCR